MYTNLSLILLWPQLLTSGVFKCRLAEFSGCFCPWWRWTQQHFDYQLRANYVRCRLENYAIYWLSNVQPAISSGRCQPDAEKKDVGWSGGRWLLPESVKLCMFYTHIIPYFIKKIFFLFFVDIFSEDQLWMIIQKNSYQKLW